VGIINLENWIPLVDGATEVCFRVPEKDELVWAIGAMARVAAPVPDATNVEAVARHQAEMKSLTMDEIPAKLAELLTNIKLPGGATPLPTWKEDLAGSVLFAHNDGIKLVTKVFFRTLLKADEPNPA
jgi:hypothetical protein